MAPRTNLNVVKQIDGVDIFEDLASLPDAEAVKKSKTRAANQKSAAARKAGTTTPRATRSPSEKKIRATGATAMPEEAKAILGRHKDEMKAHDAALSEFEKKHAADRRALEAKHDAELTKVRELVAAIQIVDAIDGSADLSKPLRAELAKIK